MAVTYVAAGSAGAGTGGVSPGLPAGIEDGDFLYLGIETVPINGDPSAANADWDYIDHGYSQIHTNTVRTKATGYYAIYDSADPPSLSIPDAGDHTLARIYAFRGVDPADPINDSNAGGSTNNTTSRSVNPGVTTDAAACMVAFIMCHGDNVSMNSGANASLESCTHAGSVNTSSGGDGAIDMLYGIKAAAGAVGNFSWNNTPGNEMDAWVVAALNPAPTTPPPPPPVSGARVIRSPRYGVTRVASK